MLELAILGLLEEQELHGYELRKRLGDTLGFLVSVSFGSLYPALARLEARGAVVALSPPPGSGAAPPGHEANSGEPRRIPMTGSLAGERAAFRTTGAASRARGGHVAGARTTRQRRVYAITEAGTVLFQRLLAGDDTPGEAEDDKGFALRLAFARYLSPEARLRLLERRRAVLTQRRARSTLSQGADSWRAALAEHGAESLDGDISWLDRLIAAERVRVTASAGSAAAEAVPASPSTGSIAAKPTRSTTSVENPTAAEPARTTESVGSTAAEPARTTEPLDSTAAEPARTTKSVGSTAAEPAHSTTSVGSTAAEPARSTTSVGSTAAEPTPRKVAST